MYTAPVAPPPAQFQHSFDCPLFDPARSFASQLVLASSSSSCASRTTRFRSSDDSATMEAQQDDCKWRQIPAFGDWNMWEDMPVTQYFQSGGAFFFAAHGEKQDEDLFKVPQFPGLKSYSYNKCVVRVKSDKASSGDDAPAAAGKKKKVRRTRQQYYVKEQQQKWKPIKGAADEEDLYKISPQLLCKVKKKKYLKNFLGGCLGLNCIA